MASLQEVFGKDFGAPSRNPSGPGTEISEVFTPFSRVTIPMCHDPKPIVDALQAVRAYRELVAYAKLKREKMEDAEKAEAAAIDKLRAARDALCEIKDRFDPITRSDGYTITVESIDALIERTIVAHAPVVSKARAEYQDAAARVEEVNTAFNEMTRSVTSFTDADADADADAEAEAEAEAEDTDTEADDVQNAAKAAIEAGGTVREATETVTVTVTITAAGGGSGVFRRSRHACRRWAQWIATSL